MQKPRVIDRNGNVMDQRFVLHTKDTLIVWKPLSAANCLQVRKLGITYFILHLVPKVPLATSTYEALRCQVMHTVPRKNQQIVVISGLDESNPVKCVFSAKC